MEYNVLSKLPTPELEVLKADALEQLFNLQNNPDVPQINYWSEVNTMCKTILKERKNG